MEYFNYIEQIEVGVYVNKFGFGLGFGIGIGCVTYVTILKSPAMTNIGLYMAHSLVYPSE